MVVCSYRYTCLQIILSSLWFYMSILPLSLNEQKSYMNISYAYHWLSYDYIWTYFSIIRTLVCIYHLYKSCKWLCMLMHCILYKEKLGPLRQRKLVSRKLSALVQQTTWCLFGSEFLPWINADERLHDEYMFLGFSGLSLYTVNVYIPYFMIWYFKPIICHYYFYISKMHIFSQNVSFHVTNQDIFT